MSKALPKDMSDQPPEMTGKEVDIHIQNIESFLSQKFKAGKVEIPPQDKVEAIPEGRLLQGPEKWFAWDIETYKAELPDQYEEFYINENSDGRLKDPAKVEANRKKVANMFALSPLTGRIILSGFIESESNNYIAIGGDNVSEKRIIRETIQRLNEFLLDGFRMITFGGKRFDLPFLMVRTLIQGLTDECQIKTSYPDLISPFRYQHLDYETILPGGLAEIAYHMDEHMTWVNDGSKIAQYYDEKRFDLIRDKNLTDLYLLRVIHSKMAKWIPYKQSW